MAGGVKDMGFTGYLAVGCLAVLATDIVLAAKKQWKAVLALSGVMIVVLLVLGWLWIHSEM